MALIKASGTSGVHSSSTAKISTARRGKSKKSYPPRKCNYCKGLFVPFQSHQKFCCENHQKLYWKYGTIPFEKLARRLENRFDEEVAPLRARVVELEAWVDLSARLGVPHDDFPIRSTPALSAAARIAAPKFADPEADEPACIDWAEIDRNRATRQRGGGAAA